MTTLQSYQGELLIVLKATCQAVSRVLYMLTRVTRHRSMHTHSYICMFACTSACLPVVGEVPHAEKHVKHKSAQRLMPMARYQPMWIFRFTMPYRALHSFFGKHLLEAVPQNPTPMTQSGTVPLNNSQKHQTTNTSIPAMEPIPKPNIKYSRWREPDGGQGEHRLASPPRGSAEKNLRTQPE